MNYKIKITVFVGLFLGASLFAQKDEQKNIDGFFEKLSDSPLVYACDCFLSDEECDYLINLAKPSLTRSTVADTASAKNLLHSARTSFGMFFPWGIKDKIVRDIHRRIAQITDIPEENGESMQVLHYGIGAEYQPHYDTFDPATPGGLIHYNRGGQRVATFIMYLNTPKKGGETIFPEIGLKITPKKGKALLFYNVNAEGISDPMSLHGGAPVIEGEKWIMTRWLREGEFR
ncbi:MAG: 2OG-Fe(II) oxygenase [Verrucomicrobia bacterium]|nr:2OG-Fe(II) oxygenase [Verrucomicrobiota bacterium]